MALLDMYKKGLNKEMLGHKCNDNKKVVNTENGYLKDYESSTLEAAQHQLQLLILGPRLASIVRS